MPERTAAEIEAALVAYLRDEFDLDESDLVPDRKLVRTGLLDSVSIVQVATWAERTFDITIPDEDIDAETLDSIAMIVDYVLARSR